MNAQRRRPFVIGVTGNIAVGKSLVLDELARNGVVTIDADRVYHQLIAPGLPLNDALVRDFGAGVRAADGSIDRRALGAIVFAQPDRLAALDRLTHPAVIAAIAEQIAQLDGGIVAVDAVKLYEAGMESLCDAVWLVVCDPEQQVARLMARNHLSREEAERRVAAQPPLGDKRARASLVIDNSRDVETTRAAVRAALEQIRQER